MVSVGSASLMLWRPALGNLIRVAPSPSAQRATIVGTALILPVLATKIAFLVPPKD